MRIYSNTLTRADLHSALEAVPGLMFREFSDLERPRVRDRGWDVQLQRRGSKLPFVMMTKGSVAASGGIGAASRDDWGLYLAALYRLDVKMQVASKYRGSGDFHRKTENKYRPKRVRKSGAQYRAERAAREQANAA
jgi:hypothetical protein